MRLESNAGECVRELNGSTTFALPRLSLRQREAALGLLFVAPQLIGWAIFVGGPLLAILYFSFFRWNIIQGTLTFIGTANFERMLTSSDVAAIARTTLLLAWALSPRR